MRLRELIGILVLSSVLAASASAQQDPLDQGAADSVIFVISEPQVGLTDQVVTVELYFFNDVDSITSMSPGFGWDNPNLQMDSAIWSPEADMAFQFKISLYRQSLDSTNAAQLFQAVGARLVGYGLVASSVPKLVLTYYFTAASWTASDQFCISREDFNFFAFVRTDNKEYVPIWAGPYCVGNVPTGVLEVDPMTLNFFGVATETNPSMQNLNVSEAGGDNIPFDLNTDAGWIILSAGSGTTPQDVGVGIDNTGLAAGDYQDSVMVSSAAATNTAWLYVNLHLDPPNQPPVLDPIGGQGGPENSLIEFTVTASDPDNGFPALNTSPLPGTASFTDHSDGTGTFSWMTTYDDAGEYSVTFTADDGQLTDDETITIMVTNVNRDPVLDPVAGQQVLEGVQLTFGLSASDPDMDALGLSAEMLPGTAAFADHGDGTGTFDWTPGNTDAGFYDVRFIVTDGDLADSIMVNIEVIDADGFTLSPNPLPFATDFGTGNPRPMAFHLSVSDGSIVTFQTSETAAWFSTDPTVGDTPTDITVTVDLTGLAAGSYFDSVMISGGGLDPVYEYVSLLITNTLLVDPTELSWSISEGDLMIPAQTLDVTEMGGDAIAFEATTEDTWLMLTDASGTTPGTVTVDVDPAAAPGTYSGTILVAADAANSPLSVAVNLTVSACPNLSPAEVVYSRITFAGETVMFDETVSVSSSGPGEINWESSGAAAYSFDPTTATTPTDVGLHYERLFDTQGDYSDTAYLSAVSTGTYSCPSQVTIVTNVTVNRPPSADTIIVVNTPAVPGMRVGVPVIFTNSCQLTGSSLVLGWESDEIHFDSVSFVGSALEYIDDKGFHETTWNEFKQVSIWANTLAQQMVPIGSEQLMGTMHFSLGCFILDGAYEFIIGEDSSMPSIMFTRDCGEGEEVENPEYIPGSIIVGTASNFVCGYVVDPFNNEIEGATVELWDDYPFTEPLLTTTSSGIGSFAFDEIMVIPFDLYAYKEGYYPGSAEDINFGEKGVMIVLEPLPETLTPTSEWVDYFCPEGPNIFLSAPVPVGAVVEAYTQAGLLVGQKSVTVSGQYGFMPVYRGNVDLGDVGAMTGDMIHFTINGMDAIATGNTTYPADFGQMEVCLEVRGTVEKVCALFEGWNLISWNVNTETDDILTVLESVMDYVDVVLGFERGGLTFDPDLQVFSTLWDVDHYSGYWVRIEGIAEINLTVTGLPVPETTPILLTSGWNLVSYLPEESWPTEVALANVESLVEFAYGFPEGQIQIWQPGGPFNQLETFDPCGGYWLKVFGDAWLVYSGVDGVPIDRPTPRRETALSSGIATTSWVNLYSRDLVVDGEQVPTGATITAHGVSDDRQIGSYTMTTDGRFGFMPVYADGAGEEVTGLNPGEEFYLAVSGVTTEEVFIWTNNGDRIEVTELSTAGSIGEVLPQGYSLAQNYPNPFNPNTTISFTMPSAGKAKIEIYNVLGRSVAVILDGQAQAGENKVVWSGKDDHGVAAASGVYFYRLTAGTYTETRKMMLLK